MQRKNQLAIIYIISFILISLLVDYLIYFLTKESPSKSNQSDILTLLGLGVLTPIVETYIFQKIPIDIAIKKENINKLFVIVALGIVFTLFHFKNIILSIPIFISGIFLSYMYWDLKEKDYYPFIVTALAHILLNIIIILS